MSRFLHSEITLLWSNPPAGIAPPIRDTDFIGPAYAIVQTMGFLTAFGLIIIKIVRSRSL
jgi:hypothetical protein